MTAQEVVDRPSLVRRGQRLTWFTIARNAVEGIAGIAAGIAAGSIALVGFGIDSYVEVFAGSVILWRLAKERHGQELFDAAEHRAVRLIAITFLVLAAGVGVESVRKLIVGAEPGESLFGISLAVVSLIVMPLLARAKRRVGGEAWEPCGHCRRDRDHAVRLAVRHPAGRARSEGLVRLVVG